MIHKVTGDEPDSIDTIKRARDARFRAVEELDGVGVEGETLELLYKVVREDVVEVEDVQGDVHHGANEDETRKEGNDAYHTPILSLNTNLTRRGLQKPFCDDSHLFVCCVTVRRHKVKG